MIWLQVWRTVPAAASVCIHIPCILMLTACQDVFLWHGFRFGGQSPLLLLYGMTLWTECLAIQRLGLSRQCCHSEVG